MRNSELVVAVLITLLLAACGGAEPPPPMEPVADPVAAHPVETSAPVAEPAPSLPETKASIKGEEVAYDVDGVKLKGYLAYDTEVEGKRPGVIIVHEWWGHNDYVRHRARMVAELGYTAFALDMYGEGKSSNHPADAKKFMTEVFSLADAGKARFDAAKKLLEAHETTDPKKTAAMGYCFGGAIVLAQARAGAALKGVASFHGNLSTKTPAKKGAVKAKLLVMHGQDDPMVPAEQVDAFKKEMEAAGADLSFIAYPGAKHAFTNPAATKIGKENNIGIAYNAEADNKSWAELKTFLAGVFGGK